MTEWFRPAGSTSRKGFDVAVTPGEKDWEHSGLYVATLRPGQSVEIDTGDVAVPEDAEASSEELLPPAVALGVLHAQEAHQCLGDGQPHGPGQPCRHRCSPRGSLGSTCWVFHSSRTQACCGSSVISHWRSVPGPAITFR